MDGHAPKPAGNKRFHSPGCPASGSRRSQSWDPPGYHQIRSSHPQSPYPSALQTTARPRYSSAPPPHCHQTAPLHPQISRPPPSKEQSHSSSAPSPQKQQTKTQKQGVFSFFSANMPIPPSKCPFKPVSILFNSQFIYLQATNCNHEKT